MESMAAAGRPPTASMYGKVLDVYQSGERWERVQAVVTSMQAVGLRPAVDTFSALLNVYEHGDQVSAAKTAHETNGNSASSHTPKHTHRTDLTPLHISLPCSGSTPPHTTQPPWR